MTKLGLDFCPQFLLCFWSPMMSESANVASLGAMPTAQPSSTGIRKQWHEDITQDLRNHLVHKLWVADTSLLLSEWLLLKCTCGAWLPWLEGKWVLSGPLRRENKAWKTELHLLVWGCCVGSVPLCTQAHVGAMYPRSSNRMFQVCLLLLCLYHGH